MMKAAQAPGVGGMPLSGNQGSHSPSHQNLHGGIYNIYFVQIEWDLSYSFYLGGGSNSGSPSHFLPPGHSPTPSSTPVSELSPGNYFIYFFF